MGDTPPPKVDRRSGHRIGARLQIRFAKVNEAARALWAYSLNFSAGGLCLKTRREYEIGTRLELAMTICGESFVIMGTVAWTRSGTVGVRFEELSVADRLRLQELTSEGRGAP